LNLRAVTGPWTSYQHANILGEMLAPRQSWRCGKLRLCCDVFRSLTGRARKVSRVLRRLQLAKGPVLQQWLCNYSSSRQPRRAMQQPLQRRGRFVAGDCRLAPRR
jgi:hypothetical protein